MKQDNIITARLDDFLYERVLDVSEKNDVTISTILRDAILHYLENDSYDLIAAEAKLKRQQKQKKIKCKKRRRIQNTIKTIFYTLYYSGNQFSIAKAVEVIDDTLEIDDDLPDYEKEYLLEFKQALENEDIDFLKNYIRDNTFTRLDKIELFQKINTIMEEKK